MTARALVRVRRITIPPRIQVRMSGRGVSRRVAARAPSLRRKVIKTFAIRAQRVSQLVEFLARIASIF